MSLERRRPDDDSKRFIEELKQRERQEKGKRIARPEKKIQRADFQPSARSFIEELKERERLKKSKAEQPIPEPTRRDFLKSAAAYSFAIAAGLTGAEILRRYGVLERLVGTDEDVDQFDYDEVVRQGKAYLKELYGANLVVGDSKDHPTITGDRMTLDHYKQSIRAIIREAGRYPPEFIRDLGADLGFEFRVMHNVQVYEFGYGRERVGGVALYPHTDQPRQVIIDSEEPFEDQRRIIHHEVNHAAAFRWQNIGERDGTWKNLHSGVSVDPYVGRAWRSYAYSAPRYYLSPYAMKSAAEDQATCAEYLLTPLLHLEFIRRIREEPDAAVRAVLVRKYAEAKREYFEWSDGRMDEAYWEEIIRAGLRERDGVS